MIHKKIKWKNYCSLARHFYLNFVVVSSFLLLVSSVLLINTSKLQESWAQSPSFVREEIVDDANDWLLWKGTSFSSNTSSITTHNGAVSKLVLAQNMAECGISGRHFSAPDIESVSYTSDGHVLNATVWLTGPFKEPTLIDKLDTFQENLKLSILKTDLSLEDYTSVKKGRIFDPLGKSIVEENTTTVSGYPAIVFVHRSNESMNMDGRFDPNANSLIVMQVWTIIDGIAYDFTYSAFEEKYYQFLPIIKQMISSFTVKNIDTYDKDINLLSSRSNQSIDKLQNFSLYSGGGIIMEYPRNWLVENVTQSRELNTVIFRSPFEDAQLNEPSWREITYTMAIDIDSVQDVGTDYRIKILRTSDNVHDGNGQIGIWNWTRQVHEVSAYDKIRTLEETKNFTSFYRSGDPYILFSLDLDRVNSPSQYKAVFYITDYYVINHRLCKLVDTTNWVNIPPPEFDISIRPTSSIVLRPNEEKTVEILIKSNSDLQSEALITTTNHTITAVSNNANVADNGQSYDDKNVLIQFTPDRVPVPQSGVGISTVFIKALENATAKLYTFPLTMNISFPTSITNRGGEIFNNSKSVNVMELANLTLTILPPYTFDEQINRFVTAWITPISGIWSFAAGVGAVIVPLILYFYRKRHRQGAEVEEH